MFIFSWFSWQEATHEIVALLQEVAAILRQPGTDVIWSRYETAEDAVADIENHAARLRRGDLSGLGDLRLLFAPTGALQEISLSSGWGVQFIVLSQRFDRALARLAH